MKIYNLLFITLLSCSWVKAQQNYVAIKPGETEADIIKKAANIVPTPRQLRWQQLELTAFFHFGINTFTGKEWGTGKEDPKIFNPASLDAQQWVKTAKEAGFKQIILTAKHHDGFCLWPTKTTAHSVKSSPWKNGNGDVVAEVAAACKKYKVGFGIYLSPWDMNSDLYGTEAYNVFFIDQLTELLTQYGQIDEVWFDGANGEGPNGKKQVYAFNRWYSLIRKLQPKAVIAIMGPDIRWVGTESGYGRETEWSVLPMAEQSQKEISLLSQKEVNVVPVLSGSFKDQDRGSRNRLLNTTGLVWYPAETDVSIRPGWFYHATEDDKVKSPEKLLDIYYNSVGRNGVLLLNIPPDKNGIINQNDIKSLKDWTKLRDETFKVNLAKDAVIISPNGRNTKAMLDGRYNTNWITKEHDSTAIIELLFKTAQTFDVLSLQENITIGQRVEKFTFEYWDEKNWVTAAIGTTIGYKRLIKFKPVTARKVRLNIQQSRLNPTISELGIFKQVDQIK